MGEKIYFSKEKIREAEDKLFEFEDNFGKDFALVEFKNLDGIRYVFDPIDRGGIAYHSPEILEEIRQKIVNKYYPKVSQKIEILGGIKTVGEVLGIGLLKYEEEGNLKEMNQIKDEINHLQEGKLLILNSAKTVKQKEKMINFIKENRLLDRRS